MLCKASWLFTDDDDDDKKKFLETLSKEGSHSFRVMNCIYFQN
jgi:hypothetical protein